MFVWVKMLPGSSFYISMLFLLGFKWRLVEIEWRRVRAEGEGREGGENSVLEKEWDEGNEYERGFGL